MKSMSIVDHGSSTLSCVCRCSSGFWSASRPEIHIFAGENVCIHAIMPMQLSAEFDSKKRSLMASEEVRTRVHTTRTGTQDEAAIHTATVGDCSATKSRDACP